MTEPIATLKAEIEAAQKKRQPIQARLNSKVLPSPSERLEYIDLGGFIRGLQTAVDLLEKQRARVEP